ncbi:tail protein [Aggregatibacter actinomycetemcomitans D17P-3]|uniref:tape measure protein n=1 Tax=Aggregatibacter actinomycetemcomitans TaxID=714 RepID=UPI0006A734FA|nr:tape measure protein [Aggregatibacter actinomycetemcomitans]KOE31385.1 tail protein [Aggregatibacter actinomycetemcomitans D17P-3]
MADNLTLALKIKADLENALTNFKAFKAELQRNKKAADGLGTSAKAGAAGIDELGKKADQTTAKLGKTRAGIESISLQLARLKTQAIGFTLGNLAVTNLTQTIDQYNNYTARIKLVSKSNAEARGTFNELMQIANQTGSVFSATAELYTRFYRALGDNANSAELLQFTRTIQQAVAVSGAGAEEAKAAIIQLSQGLASGTLRGEEFNSVAEQMPILLEVLQKSLGKTRGELRKMAEQGELTPKIILSATKEAADEIQRQYEQMPLTIGRAVNQLSNSWLEFIGNTDKTLSASKLVAGAISSVADNLDLLAAALIIAGTAYTVHLITPLAKKAAAWAASTFAIGANTVAINANASAQVRTAQATIIAIRAIEGESASVARLSQAYGALAVAKARAAASNIGASLLGGGWVGVALTAAVGLYAAYQYLKSKEEELEAQYQQTTNAIQSNIDKTEALIEARTKLGEIGGFSERISQVETNNKTIEEARQQLDALIAKRDQLLERGQESFLFKSIHAEELDKINKQINQLDSGLTELASSTREVANLNRQQLTAAFNAAIETGGELAEKLKAIGDPQAPEAMELLKEAIKKAEEQMTSMDGELNKIESKIRQELTNSTMTATEQLEAMKTKFLELGAQAGASAGMMDGFISRINTIIDLQNQLDFAKQVKEADKFIESLQRRLTTKTKGTAAGIKEEARSKGLTGDQLAQADALAEQIEAAEKAKKTARSSKSRYDATDKNLALNVQYLRLTGQEVKANLADIEGRYSKLLAEFTKHSNVDGINLIKKLLPLEQAKVQVDGVQNEINRLYQSQSAAEQRIQTQVQVGVISQIEGQRQLKALYAETVAELEKQIPILEKLAQLPGVQGQAAKGLLDDMKLKIAELNSAGDDLEKTFKEGLTQGLQSSIVGLAKGTMTLRDAMLNLANTVLNAIIQLEAKRLAMQLTGAGSSLLGSIGSAFGGTLTAATGGYIRGPGTGTSDSIPARLSDGEYVVKAASVAHYGVGFMHAINRRQLRSFAQGGPVSVPPLPSYREPGLSQSLREGRGGAQVVASPVNIQQTLAVDSAELFTAGINTNAGTKAVLTVIRANKETLKQDFS